MKTIFLYCLLLCVAVIFTANCSDYTKSAPANTDPAKKNHAAVRKEVPIHVYGMSENAGIAHYAANEFTERAGQLLKDNAPSEISDLTVMIYPKIVEGKELIYFYYYCRVVETTPDKAQYYFDHRGTVASGKTIVEARAIVNERIKSKKMIEDVIESFIKEYNNYLLPDNFVKTPFTQTKDGKYWYLAEYFITAKEKLEVP